jgi:uncharacterized protein YrzB (UPF0473 family)
MIGIFCIIDEKIIAKKINLDEVKELGEHKDSGFLYHIEFKNINEKIPRGRVVYNILENIYEIFVSQNIIKNKKYQSMILKEFDIDKNYRFIIDTYIQSTKKAEILFFKINEIIRKIDPYNIAWVSFDEYYPEVNDITLKFLKEKKDEFQIVKEVFDKWFFEDERKINAYKKIAQKLKNLSNDII